jgi:hypothetical protein
VGKQLTTPDSCQNCRQILGRFEQPYVWNQSIVCPSCYDRLATTSQETTVYYRAGAVVLTLSHLVMGHKQYPLENLTSVARETRKRGGQGRRRLILLGFAFGVIPFLFAAIQMPGANAMVYEYASNPTGPRYVEAAEWRSFCLNSMIFGGVVAAACGVTWYALKPSRWMHQAVVTTTARERHAVGFNAPEHRDYFADVLGQVIANRKSPSRIVMPQAPRTLPQISALSEVADQQQATWFVWWSSN